MAAKLKSRSEPENPSTSISSSDRTLRIITVLTFEPALALLITHGVLSRDVCPALGLVPLFLSAAFGLVHSCKTVKSRSIDQKIDAFLAVFLMSILIPGWVELAERRHASMSVLGAYGTMPMMINFCIHTYFASRNCVVTTTKRLFKNVFEAPRCPQCHGKMQKSNWRKANREGSIHSHEGEERYRDEPDAEMGDDVESIVSGSSSRNTAKPNVAPLFKAPPQDEDDDPAVMV